MRAEQLPGKSYSIIPEKGDVAPVELCGANEVESEAFTFIEIFLEFYLISVLNVYTTSGLTAVGHPCKL
jgi:hypothetical protein